MTNAAILVASSLLLGAYLLDIVGRRFKLPSVVLLIVSGMIARQVLDRLGLHLGHVGAVVPIIGTLGLILIVFEGALDLEVSRERLAVIARAVLSSIAGFVACTMAFAALFHWTLGFTPYLAALAAVPFAVISSAVAIPSATGLPAQAREFVIYESSFADIVGVLVFTALLSSQGDPAAFARDLFGGGAISVVVALAASVALYALVNKVDGHVRFLPLIAGLFCLYAIGKALHLSPLVFVLVAGLVIANPHLLDRWAPLEAMRAANDYERTVAEFKSLVAELTFATKSFFFLLLGYWTEVGLLAVPVAWAVAAACTGFVFASRRALLAALRVEHAAALTWIAPRGLITVLLFLAAAEAGGLEGFPFGALMLTVLATSTLVALAHHGQDDRREALAASAIDSAHAPLASHAVPAPPDGRPAA